jgi:TetR/AcrR family transcriptional regulator, ethionamide resistance regulator
MAATLSTDLGSRNPTEDAILAAAREALHDEPYDAVTIDGIARRAYVSRTTVYFYFPNKRAVVDRLIQRAFADILEAASPYLEGEGDPRAELHAALAGVVAIVDRDASILRLALWLYGREDQLPAEWAPHIQRLVVAGAKRIARDQERGLAPDDIPARTSALALSAMVERHVGMEIVRSGRDGHESIRVLSELWWRAVYSKPEA